MADVAGPSGLDVAPSAVFERWAIAAIAVIAALPSLVWGVTSAAYLSDDYWIAYWFDDLGIAEAMRRIAFEMPGRLLAAPYYLVIYEGLGPRPVVQSLVLAVLNGMLVVVLWRLGRRVLPPEFVLIACAIFAVLPNRTSTRVWFVVGSYPLAMILMAAGLLALLRRRPAAGGLLLAAAALLYEGVAVLALWLVVLLVIAGHCRWRDAGSVGGIVALAALVAFVLSPKRASASGVGPFGAADTLASGLLGRGLTDGARTGPILAVAVFALVGLSVATMAPGFRVESNALARVRLGASMALAGAVPALVGGAAFAVAGLGDRSNLVAGAGIAVIIAAVLDRARDIRLELGLLVGVPVLVGMFALTMADVASYGDAIEEGDAVLAALDAAFPDEPPRVPTLIVPALVTSPGVAAFVPNIDIRGAMHLRRGGDWSALTLVETVDCSLLDGDDRWFVVDFEQRQNPLRSEQGTDLEAACRAATGG